MPDARSVKPPEADAEELQRRLDLLREEVRERPQASIYIDVKGGKARLIFQDGQPVFVNEGEAIRVWPGFHWREEPGA